MGALRAGLRGAIKLVGKIVTGENVLNSIICIQIEFSLQIIHRCCSSYRPLLLNVFRMQLPISA